MNICIFSANYLPNIGGVERYTYYLSKELIKKGHAVTVVTNNVFDLASYEIQDGIELFRLPCYNVMNGRYPIHKKNRTFYDIDATLCAKNFDIVIVNTRFYFHSLYGAKFAYKKNIRCITIEHGTAHLTVNNPVFDLLGQAWEHLITAVLKRYCHEFYGVSKAACAWSAHFKIKSNGVLYNAVDVFEIEELMKNPVCSYKKELGIPQNATVVAFTGRIIPEKGVVQLVEAFKNINKQDAYLILAGDGPLLNTLKVSDKRIIFLGKIDFNHVISLLNESDIFCLPSVSEGFSTSVLEAVAAKNFIITTKAGGTKELISSEKYGIITESNTVQEVEDALKKAIDDIDYRNSAINEAYNRLCENFTWEKTAQKVVEIIKKGK